MNARMKNPAVKVPGVMNAIQELVASIQNAGTPVDTLHLAHLRASQINGCSACVDSGLKEARKAGLDDERLFAAAAWQEAPCFSEAERAALALAEAMTRFSDEADPVPDKVWAAAAEHYDEQQLSTLVLWIAMTNMFNRVNRTTRQVAGAAW